MFLVFLLKLQDRYLSTLLSNNRINSVLSKQTSNSTESDKLLFFLLFKT